MDRNAISAIIEQYRTHGWELRRALITPELKGSLPEVEDIFGSVEVRIGPNAGLWFSRRSQPDHETWELRRISASPFAVVAILPDSAGPEERELDLADAENRMFNTERRKESSH